MSSLEDIKPIRRRSFRSRRQQYAFSLKAVQQSRAQQKSQGAKISGAEISGALTPRQRPNRHGRYHRAPGGFVSGTLSIPEVPQGWQRNRRASVIQPPPHNPKRSIASSA